MGKQNTYLKPKVASSKCQGVSGGGAGAVLLLVTVMAFATGCRFSGSTIAGDPVSLSTYSRQSPWQPASVKNEFESTKNATTYIATVGFQEPDDGQSDPENIDQEDSSDDRQDKSSDSDPDEKSAESRSATDKSSTQPVIEAAIDGNVDLDQDTGSAFLSLDSVLTSTIDFYPEIEAVVRELEIAEGQSIQAAGSFDTKVKAISENTPVGFYETYRSEFGVEQPTFNGGSVFAGYRFGRGDFEPWYLERNTNELGELKLGANWALLRGREIDTRRVQLWQASLQQQTVEPLVQSQLIFTLRDAEIAYWNWLVAGQIFRLNERLLKTARDRVEGIQVRIKDGDIAPIVQKDNDRSILSRQVKLIKSRAKLDQAAIKLSLFSRDASGQPRIPTLAELPELDTVTQWDDQQDPESLVANAIECRPEVNLINLEMQSLALDLAKARNDLLPELNAQLALSQDFGDPTSASAAASSSTQSLLVFFDEKDQFKIDAGISITQSVQRRKATGKIRSLQGKQQQLQIKFDFLRQKIQAEVRQNYQLTSAANQQIQLATEALKLARELSQAARDRLEEGDFDLFEVIVREQQELDSAVALLDSAFDFYISRANLNASVGCDPYQVLQALSR